MNEPDLPGLPPPVGAPMPTLAVDPELLAASQMTMPRMPERTASDRVPLPPRERPSLIETAPEPDEPIDHGRGTFHVRKPLPEAGLGLLVIVVPLALAAIAGLLGVHFQRMSHVYDRGEMPDRVDFVEPIKELIRGMGVVGACGLVILSIWSLIIVTNTNRVCRSLRTPWFAALGWLLAPAIGMVAHVYLDERLHSGSLIGLTVFLAALYLPFGTLGGAARDLGGSLHLARTWYLASVIGAFLLIVGLTGSTKSLPSLDDYGSIEVRSFACYLAAIMLLASAPLALATSRNLHALVDHRWMRENDPTGTHGDPNSTKVKRSGRRLRRRLTPTLFLRVLVTAGLGMVGIASVLLVFSTRGRALQLPATSAERQSLLDDAISTAQRVALVSLAVHAIYVVWAIVAARNAHRRSLMAPTPWAVVAAFLLGPIVMAVGAQVTGPLGAAVFVVGIALAVGGFIVGQLVLGRTVSSLGGQGRIFLAWLIIDFGTAVYGSFIVRYTDTRAQVIAYGVVQIGFVLIGAALAWTAMTRLDRVVREYRPVVSVANEGVRSNHGGGPAQVAGTGQVGQSSEPVPVTASAPAWGRSSPFDTPPGGEPLTSSQS